MTIIDTMPVRPTAAGLANHPFPQPSPPRAGTGPARRALPADGPVTLAPAAHRLPMFDAMRVVAALAVVGSHGVDAGLPKRLAVAVQFGVAFFTVAALILLARSLDRRPDQRLADYAAARARRVVVPLAAWSLIYVAFHFAMHHLSGHPAWDHYGFGRRAWYGVGAALLLGGAALHLWFLPFILGACVAGFPVLKFAAGRPAARWWLVPALVAAGAASLFLPRPFAGFHPGVRVFLTYSFDALPTFCWGLAVATVYPRRPSPRAAWWAAAAGVAAFAAASIVSWHVFRSPAARGVKGLAASAVALSPWSPWLVTAAAGLGRLSFGVYLVHMLVLDAYRALARPLVPAGAAWFAPALIVAAFATSYGLAILFNRTRAGRWLFP